MASWEDLLAQTILGSEGQIKAANPYFSLQAVPEAIGGKALQLVAQDPTRYSKKEALLWGLGSGLASGLLGGAGAEYQNTLRDRYNAQLANVLSGKPTSSENLPSELFGNAKTFENLFKVNKTLGEQEAALKQSGLRGELQKTFLTELIKNPRGARQALKEVPGLGQVLGINAPEPQEAPVAVPVRNKVVESLDELGPKLPLSSVRDLEKQAYQENIDAGMPAVQAASSAKALAEERRARAKSLFGDTMKEEAAKIGDFEAIIQKGEEGLAKAGKTGSSIASTYEKVLSWAPDLFPEAAKQAEGDKALKLTQNLGASLNRIRGTGALSDFESRALFETAMSPTSTNVQNQLVLRGYKNGLAAMKEHSQFVNYVMDQTGGNPDFAQTLWDIYKEENPIVKPKADGTYVENKERVPWQKYDFASAYKRFLSGEKGAATPSIGPVASPSGSSTNQLNMASFIAEAKAKGLTKEQAKALWVKQGGA